MIEIETKLVNDPIYSREALNELKEEKPIGPKVGNHAVGVVEGCPCCNTPT